MLSVHYLSSDVNILVHVILVPPQILLLHQPRNALLNHHHLGHEMALDGFDRLRLELFIRELFLRFHDSHNGSVEIMLPVAVDMRLRTLRFFGLHRCVSHHPTVGSSV